jgi:predicted dehydrogenase
MGKIRTAVVGAGKMGSIHARIYRQLKGCELVGVVDVDSSRAGKLAKKYKCSAFGDCADILGKVDAVTIATPTITHYELAKVFIENGVAVLIEKPLVFDVAQGRELVELAEGKGVVVGVGHSERCNPVVQALKRLEIEPKFIESTRISPYPFRSTDVGVVMDVMIHDIDIILSLAASKIEKVDAVGVSVIDEQEDICNARIVFESGCIANVTASRLALKTERKVRVFSRQAYLSLDYLKKTGTIVRAAPNVDVVEKVREMRRKGGPGLLKMDWAKLLKVDRLDIDDAEPLRLEQESFLRAVAGEVERPEVSAAEGLAAVECADRILGCISKHRLQKIGYDE